MIAEKYKILIDQRLPENFAVPDTFFIQDENKNPFCIFMISCLGADRFLYLDDNFYELTGYTNEQFRKGGMDFWFPLINPEDMPQVSARIIESHKEMAYHTAGDAQPAPLVLEYRFKHPTIGWVGLRDTRYLVSFTEEKIIDQVLCRFDRLLMWILMNGQSWMTGFAKKNPVQDCWKSPCCMKNQKAKQPLSRGNPQPSPIVRPGLVC